MQIGCVRKTKIASYSTINDKDLHGLLIEYSTEKFLRKPTSQILRDLIQFVLTRELECHKVYLLMSTYS
jgi:hypothetical protein